jgi:hypothetical protein
MATVYGNYITEKQRCGMFFCWQKDSMQRILIKKRFPFKLESVCRIKRLTTGSRSVANVSLMMKTLKKRAKVVGTTARNFYAAGFDALVRQWNKFISAGGGYVEK